MRTTGILWENAASQHLQQSGLALLERNFTCRFGEIDLVLLDRRARGGECVVFAEVRYRRSDVRGGGLASVGAGKRARLLRAAALYLQAHPEHGDRACRFDVVACSGTPAHPRFDWIQSAFEA